MSRTVTIARNAHAIAYIDVTDPACGGPGDGFSDRWAWEDFIDELRTALRSRFPSLADCHRFTDRECVVVAENNHAEIVISHYENLVSVCLCPRGEPRSDPLADHWVRHTGPGFVSTIRANFGPLRKVATASNGEAFYRRVD